MASPWWFDFEEEINTHPMPPRGKKQLIALNEARTTLKSIERRRGAALGVGITSLVLIALWSLIFTWASAHAPSPWMPVLYALVTLSVGAPIIIMVAQETSRDDITVQTPEQIEREKRLLIGALVLTVLLLILFMPLLIILLGAIGYSTHQTELKLRIEVGGRSFRPEEVTTDPRYQAAACSISVLEQCARLRDRIKWRSPQKDPQEEYLFRLDTVERYEDEAWGMLTVLADSFAEHPLGQAEVPVPVHWKLMEIKCLPMLTELKRLGGRR